jgi:hypothetical protein
MASKLRRVLAVLLMAFWWGGFTFYAGRVVFIGAEVLHSQLRQGFITERVTTELNWLGVVTLAAVAWQLAAAAPSPQRKVAWLSWGVALATLLVLFAVHAQLASMLDFSARQVSIETNFENWHTVYLCTATTQWVANGILLALLQWIETAEAGAPADAGACAS